MTDLELAAIRERADYLQDTPFFRLTTPELQMAYQEDIPALLAYTDELLARIADLERVQSVTAAEPLHAE